MRWGRIVRPGRQDSRIDLSHQDETTRTTDTDGETTEAAVPGAAAGSPDADAPTIGTGTSLALGCVAGTILLILIGLLYILILAIF